MSDEEHKLQVDDDWKTEAAAEKERLSESAEERAARPGLPEADLTGLVQLLAMQAMVGLGGMTTAGGQQIPPNVELAKHHIDLLEVLEQKTKGNLEAQEAELLNTTLHQLRMAYVETVQAGGVPTEPPPSAPTQ
jgi:hypothetical protein